MVLESSRLSDNTTVMYFGLTNSPATFQAMMNDLFRNLINQGDTATFIDDILVTTEMEEGHDELVEEVLRRLEENDLFVKPEKCKWKVREVEFLGVVIGPKGEGGRSPKLAST